jgi:hypothetical protein
MTFAMPVHEGSPRRDAPRRPSYPRSKAATVPATRRDLR